MAEYTLEEGQAGGKAYALKTWENNDQSFYLVTLDGDVAGRWDNKDEADAFIAELKSDDPEVAPEEESDEQPPVDPDAEEVPPAEDELEEVPAQA